MSDQNKVEVSISVKTSGQQENSALTKALADQQKQVEQLTRVLGGLADAQGKLSNQSAADAQERSTLRQARAAKELENAERKKAQAIDETTQRWLRDLDEQDAREDRLEKEREKRFRQEQARQEQQAKQAVRRAEQSQREQEASLTRQARLALLPAIGVSGASLGSVGQAGVGALGAFGVGGGAASGAGVLGGILSSVGPAGIAAAAAAISFGVLAKELTGLVVSEAAGARELQNFALRLDISMAAAQRLQIAARLTGIEIGALEQSSRVLANALEDPTGQGKKAAESLQHLGIALNDSQGQVREEGAVLLDLLQKLAALPTAAERFEVASRTLSRGAKVLSPLLADSALLKTLLTEDGQAFDEANKKLLEASRRVNELDNSWKLFKKELAAEVAPILIPVFYVVHSLIGGTTGEVNFKPYKLQAPKPPNWEETYKNAFQSSGIQTPEQSAAKAFRDKEYKTSPDFVQGELTQQKRDNDALRARLDSADLSLNARKDLEKKLKDGEDAERRIKDHLKSFEQVVREENGIKEALRKLELQTRELESWNDPDGALKAKHDSFVENFSSGFAGRKQGLNKDQLAEVDRAFSRQQNAERGKDEDARKRSARSEQFRLEQDQLKKQQEYEDHISRAGFKGSTSSSDGIEMNTRRAIAARQELLKQEEDEIRLQEKNPARQADQLGAAGGRAKIDILGLEYDKKKLLFDLNERLKNQEEESARRIRGLIVSDNRSEIGKDFSQDARLASIKIGPGAKGAAEVEARQKQLELAQRLYQMDLAAAAEETDADKQKYDIVKAVLDLKDKDRQAEREHQIAVAEADKEREEKLRQIGGQFFDAFISKDPAKSLANFGLGQAKSIGRTLGGNAAAEVFKGRGLGLSGAIPGQTEDDGKGGQKLTTIGRILSGTPFGVDTQKDALAKETDALHKSVDASTKLEQTIQKLIGVFTGDTPVQDLDLGTIDNVLPLVGQAISLGGGSSSPLAQGLAIAQSLGSVATGSSGSAGSSFSGISKFINLFNGSSSGTSAGATANSGGAGDENSGGAGDENSSFSGSVAAGGTLSSKQSNAFKFPGGGPSVAGGLFNPDATNSEKALSAIGTAGVLFGAEQGIAAGIKQGGAKGTIGAITSVTGAAAALDPEPISKAILAGVSLVGGIIGGFFGDPKQQRSDQITRRLAEDKYEAPQTLNRSETSSGDDAVTNKYGQVSDSGFSDLFSGTAATQTRYKGTYYSLPGSIQEVYQAGYNGLQQSQQGSQINLTVQALDSQSILDRSADIGAAVTKELINGSPVGNAIQQKVLGS